VHADHDSGICEFCGNKLDTTRLDELAAHFNEADAQLKKEVDDLADRLVAVYNTVNNINLVDRMNFYQEFQSGYTDRLKRLTDIAKNDFNLYVGAYTGYNIEDLALAGMNLDFIVDGKWNGIPVTDIKTNQRIFISNNGSWNKISYSQWINNNNRYTKNAA
jgi:alpha-acetolactate decarboxylase